MLVWWIGEGRDGREECKGGCVFLSLTSCYKGKEGLVFVNGEHKNVLDSHTYITVMEL